MTDYTPVACGFYDIFDLVLVALNFGASYL